MTSNMHFNIVALDRASATFIKLAGQVDRLSERLDKLDRKEVTVGVNVKTDESRKALDSFSTRFKLMASGIIASSPVIGGAITAGIGAGFIGVAALAQSSNKEVQDTYQTLWRNVVSTTKLATDQLVPQIVGAGQAIDAQIAKLGPDLEKAFSFAGADIVALTRGVNDFAENAMPGVVSSMQHSLPVFAGVASLMGQMGTAAGEALIEIGQHSNELGTVMASFGSIVSSVVGTVVDIATDLGDAWAENAGGIISAVDGITGSISGLSQGALPALSAGLGAVVNVVDGVVTVVEPLSPILGTVGATALVTWGAFKLAGLATAGVKLLANGILSLGANMEVGATKTAGFIAGLRGVQVQASATAGAVTAAGAATARASLSMAAGLSALAGPIGIVLTAGTVLFGLFADSSDRAGETARSLAAATDQMAAAFEASEGKVNETTNAALRATPVYTEVADAARQFGVSQHELTEAIVEGGPAFDALLATLVAIAQAMPQESPEDLDRLVPILGAIQGLRGLRKAHEDAKKSAEEFAVAENVKARTLVASTEFTEAAAGASNILGMSLTGVVGGFVNVVASGKAASDSVSDVTAAFLKGALGIAGAQQNIEDHFVSVDRAVVSASQSLADAHHSHAGSVRAVRDAYAGVRSAQLEHVRAQEQERRAQVDLNKAREQAIQDLKDLHLQLQDQVVSEGQARLRLFDAQQEAATLGVNASNAAAIASQVVTEGNEDQVKAALDLLGAQNSLNSTMNSGTKLRKDVAEADKAGVEGSKGVLAAQDALRSAQERVATTSYGVQRAHQAVSDAEYNRVRSADRLILAQQALADAQGAASRSLDISTKAGQNNLAMLLGLWDAIGKTGMQTEQKYQAMIDQTAGAFGISKQAAADMLTQLGLIPKDFRYSVTAVAAADLLPITEQTINGVRVFSSSLGSGGIASAGRLASGGPVGGIGGPRDDANLIWASRGEYMQPADVVDHYGYGVMEAMRSKRLRVVGSDGASLPGYAKGGLIDAFATYANLSTAFVSDVNALQVMGFPHPPQLPKYVPPPPSASPMIGFKPSAGVAQWAGLALQALGMLGQPAALLPNVLRRMNQESGGNPTVVNRWDSNWARGTPSVGLMQVIGPTFRRWAGPFANTGPFLYGTSVDPLANIFAGLNYAIHRYPSLQYAMDKPGGYKNGGWLMPGQLAYNETSRPEAVFNQKQLAEMGGTHYHLHNNGVIGSQRELENWFVQMADKTRSRGRT